MLYYTNPEFIEDVLNATFGGFSNFKTYIEKDKIELELPGVKKEEIELSYEDKIFKIKWNDKRGIEHSKTYSFPTVIDEDDIKVSYVDGLLTIDFKSKEKKSKKGTIKL